jgi:hypothetical protein
MSLDLTNMWLRIGKLFQNELEQNIVKQNDITRQNFSQVAPSTAERRASYHGAHAGGKISNKGHNPATGATRKGKAKSVPVTRLKFTNRFWQGAFRYYAQGDQVEVYVSNASYPVRQKERPIRFVEIVKYNNRGSNEVNKKIKDPPLVFPNDAVEVEIMPAYQKAYDIIKASVDSGEIHRYFAEQGFQQAMHNLEITI